MAEPVATVNGILEDVVGYIAYLVGLLRDWIGNLVSQAIAWITGVIASLAKWLTDALGVVIKWISDTFAAFVKWLQDLLTPVIRWLQDAWQVIYDYTVEALQRIGAFVSDVIAQIRSFASSVITTVTQWIESAAQAIGAVVDGVIDGILEVVSAAKEAVVGFVTDIVTRVIALLSSAVQTIQAAWAALVTGAEALIREIGQRLVDVKEAFADLAIDVVKAIGEVGDEYVKPLRDTFRSFADAYIPERDSETLTKMIGALQGTRTDPGQMDVFRNFWRDGFADLAKRGPVYQTTFSFLFVLLTVIPSVVRIGGVLTETSIQEWNRRFPWQVLQPADAAQAERHGLVTKAQALDEIRRAGYDDDRAEMILRLTAAVPQEGDLLAMRLRGVLDDPALETALKQRGYDGQWTGRIRQMAQLIPPIQDLIVMAVREAFSPEVAARFGQYEDYPKDLTTWAQKQGLSEEWSQRYWAAHWSLPSPQQGFEMLHRGVIGREDLGLLLRALDVMPFWRERLTQIAYSPFTRVDIRRMHQMRVLTDEEVYRAHLDLGYDEEKAQRLTEFVLQLNRRAVTEDDIELGKLSRTAILGFYEDGVITRASAQKLLQDIGHTLDAASLYLDAVDMQEQRSERKERADLIIDQARAGALTFDQAQDQLRRLGLETVEVEKAVARLLRALEAKVKLPTQDDGERFYVQGTITRDDYEDLLSRLGFAQKWRQAYLNQAEAKKHAGPKSGGA